jgi:hypothetical protein
MPPSPQRQTQLVGLYERAVELDPSSAPALAGPAEALLDTEAPTFDLWAVLVFSAQAARSHLPGPLRIVHD